MDSSYQTGKEFAPLAPVKEEKIDWPPSEAADTWYVCVKKYNVDISKWMIYMKYVRIRYVYRCLPNICDVYWLRKLETELRRMIENGR